MFGWSFVDHPMGPDGTYTIFELNGRSVAAGYTQQPAETSHGVPPHWNLYVAVENADASAARAAELGAMLPAGVFDVGTNGRMAVVIDPTGASFCLWQPNQTPGLGVMGDLNTYCWADLSTSDRPKAKKFYEDFFGWTISPGKDKDESTYLHIGKGNQFFAGILPDSHRQPGVPPHWMPYFMVGSADDATAKAQSLGARVYLPPMTVDKTLRIAVLADPQGAVFALFQP
jgi:predicted enzyme related to lactoylglutathione lyase